MRSSGRCTDLFAELWEPFLTPSSAGSAKPYAQVTERSEGWWLRLGYQDPMLYEDIWPLADSVFGAMFRHAVAQARGVICLHAGVVVKGTACLLLVGPSGAGKTTLTLDLLRSQDGWEYFSDDLAPIELRSGGVRPFPKPLSVKDPNRWRAFHGLWQPPSWLPSPRGRFVVAPGGLPLSKEKLATPRLMLFLDRRAGSPASRSLSAANAAARCGQFIDGIDRAALGTLGRMCRDVDALELRYGTSKQALAVVKEMVETGSLGG
ncbi:MAG: hypothetical protein ABR529_04960 [Actinomycetota bacterium]